MGNTSCQLRLAVAIPADAALMMQILGAEGVLLAQDFQVRCSVKRAAAIVKAVTNYQNPHPS